MLFLSSLIAQSVSQRLEKDDVTGFVQIFEKASTDATLLHQSVKAGAAKITEFLLQQDTEVDGYNAEGLTPLHIAVSENNVNLTRLLVNAGANINLKTRGGLEATPLMLASSIEDTTLSDMLIQAGADVNIIDVNGDPALNWAAYYGYTKQMKLLIASGADLSVSSKHGNVADVVLRLWQADSVAEVLRHTSLAGKISGQAARLVASVNSNDLEAVKKFLKNGGDPNTKEGLGTPVLQLAAQKGSVEVVQLLLESGANPDKLNRVGQAPLAFAARFGHHNVVRQLIDQNADVNATDQRYRLSPLMGAAVNGDTRIGQLLLGGGANIDHTDSVNHCSALHWALFYGNTDFAAMLINAGADYEMKVLDDRHTAHSLARFYGNDDIATLIEVKQSQGNPLLGSWKFKAIHYIYKDTTYSVHEAYPGTFVVAPSRYAIMYNPSDEPRQPFQSLSKPTDAEIKAAFQSIVFNSGTYEVSSGMIVTTSDIARVPGFEGGKQYYEYEVEGDSLRLKMVDETYPNGSKPAWFKKLEVLFILSKE